MIPRNLRVASVLYCALKIIKKPHNGLNKVIWETESISYSSTSKLKTSLESFAAVDLGFG